MHWAMAAFLLDATHSRLEVPCNDGSIVPVIAATFPLNQAAEAHRMMESGELIGKIVLTTQEPEP